MKNWMYIFVLLGFVAVTTTSCGDDPEVENEEEVITTMEYTLTAPNGSVVTMSFSDGDGDGGAAPVVTGGTLMANTVYTGAITLANEAVTPAEDITAEILEEDEEHQFFFAASSGLNATVVYGDTDADGNPVGLTSTLTTGAASTGTLTVTLRHEPNKSGANVAAGDITNAGGETDIEVEFDVEIQ